MKPIELQDDLQPSQSSQLRDRLLLLHLVVWCSSASVLTTLLPPPFACSQRLLAVMAEVLERSTLPGGGAVVSVSYWFFSGDALPALWESGWRVGCASAAPGSPCFTCSRPWRWSGWANRISTNASASFEGQVRTSRRA